MSSQNRAETNRPAHGPQHADRGGLLAWIALGAVAILFFAYLRWRPATIDANGVDHPAVGQPLAYLELEPLTGGSVEKTAADLEGTITLINIWGTWCPPCAQEFPYLAAIYDRFRSNPAFQYLSISYDDKPKADLREATDEFLQRMRVEHPTYFDAGSATLQRLNAIGIGDAFPTTIVIDAQRTIRGVWRGFDRQSMTEIEQVLRELLDER
jgi:thiol-disulfide isomerase/thioredoxin